MSLTLKSRAVNTSASSRRSIARINPVDANSLNADTTSGVYARLSGAEDALVLLEVDEKVAEGSIVVDDTTLYQTLVPSGSMLQVSVVELKEFESVVLTSKAHFGSGLDRVAVLLLGKPMRIGQRSSLKPLADTVDNLDARLSVNSALGGSTASTYVVLDSASSTEGYIGPKTQVSVKESGGLRDLASSTLSSFMSSLSSSTARVSSPVSAGSVMSQKRPAPVSGPAYARVPVSSDTRASAAAASLLPEVEEKRLSVSDLPSLSTQAALLEEWLDLGLSHKDLFEKIGSAMRLGILISGPSGVGKTSLVHAVANSLNLEVITLSGSRLSALEPTVAFDEFKKALNAAKGGKIVLFSSIEKILGGAPTPFSVMLLETLDELPDTSDFAFIATTSNLDSLTSESRHHELLPLSITIPVPNLTERRAVLGVITSGIPLEGVNLDDLASRTPGFVPADLKALCEAAALSAASRARSTASAPTQVVHVVAAVDQSDFNVALDRVKASSLDGSSLEVDYVDLDSVKGIDPVKQVLTEAVLWPLKYPESFQRLGVPAPRGVLLYGPPGCGKTYVVKALAGTGKANVFSVKGAELLSKWVGDSEAAVRDLFARARAASPSIIFLDELDALAPARGESNNGVSDRVVASLLTELDGVEGLKNVVVIGATNRPDLIDPALLRPGRLGRSIFLPPPDEEARALILAGAASNTPFKDVDWDEVASLTADYSAADCAALIQESGLVAMREDMEALEVTRDHIEKALATVRPSLDQLSVQRLKAFSEAKSA